MRESLATELAPSIAIGRTFVPARAQMCTGKFASVVRALWPDKPAENLAAHSGASIRNAKYVLAGREPTAAMVRAVTDAMLSEF